MYIKQQRTGNMRFLLPLLQREQTYTSYTVNPNKFRILKTVVETDYLKVFE